MHLALLVSVRAFFRPRWHTLYAKRDAEPVGHGEEDTDPSAKRTRLNGAERLNGEVYGEHLESVIPAHRSPRCSFVLYDWHGDQLTFAIGAAGSFRMLQVRPLLSFPRFNTMSFASNIL